jgi:hypothetical protein
MHLNESLEHFVKVVLYVAVTQHVKRNFEIRNGVALSRIYHYVVILFLSLCFQYSFTIDDTRNIRLIFHMGVTLFSILRFFRATGFSVLIEGFPCQ